jgi:hypothetical protein
MSGGGSSSNNNTATRKCGMYELIIFLAAIVTGTACSICSKTMMELHGNGITGDMERFTKPLFQTFGMFIGMLFGLIMHVTVVVFKIPFPGYEHEDTSSASASSTSVLPTIQDSKTLSYGSITKEEKEALMKTNSAATITTQYTTMSSVPLWMYFFLGIPAIFDLGATALCMMGLRYLDVSIYQLLRGSGIIFVALVKQHVLGDHLYTFQWWGVAWNVVSVFLVGATAILNSEDEGVEASGTAARYGGGEALLGILLVMTGAFVQAMQFIFEEKVMTMDEAAAPPLLLIGMEGLWGTILCLTIMYPLAYYLPGDDHGSYEDPFNTWHMVTHSSTIQWAFLVYFFAIFAYNMFAILVTYSLNSIWHAILDNFRPITVWCTDMFIFYAIVELQGKFGEPWTKYSWVQLLGMMVLLYGTAVYNAPNAGSVKLLGQWYALGVNLQHEYDAIDSQIREAELEEEWEERQTSFKQRRASSLAEHSPYVSMHTQALRGLASPKI